MRGVGFFFVPCDRSSAEEKEALLLDDAETYHYTNQSDTYTGSSHDDEDEFTGARQDFAELGFSAEQVRLNRSTPWRRVVLRRRRRVAHRVSLLRASFNVFPSWPPDR